jgi:glutamate-1-semialdehyde 2,1-aminomutase
MAITPAIDFEYHKRANESIAQGYLTNSKNPECLIKGVYPTHIVKAKGCYLYDQKGNVFTDYICGLGSNLFGYANPLINNVAISEMNKGISLSLPTRTEVHAAETIKEIFLVDRVKFLKTGTEACIAALKIARNYTGRNVVLSEGYHGWGQEFTSLTPPAAGCNPQVYIHSLESINQINKDVAAVIVEPVQLDYSLERRRWLKQLRDKCTETGTVLIFDEIITGCRFKKFSVSKAYGIVPDILILGKAIAGGFPLAAVCGKKELMDDKNYFVSSTFAGENMSLAACVKALNMLRNDQDYQLDDLWRYGEDFYIEFNSMAPDKICLSGYPTRGRFEGDKQFIWVFWQEAVKAGMLFGPSFFINFSHREIMYKSLQHIKDIFNKMAMKMPRLEGEEPCPPFSSKSRQ